MTLSRVRFKVPEMQQLHVSSILRGEGISARTYVEIMLTHLCAPHHPHPVVAVKGLSSAQQLFDLMRAADDPDVALYQFRWPPSILRLVDPALELAEMHLPEFLSILWQWSQSPKHELYAVLAARLAAFSSYYSRVALGWGDIYAARTSTGTHADPHAMLAPRPEVRNETLPWVIRVKGF